jgi:hypothetical protein
MTPPPLTLFVATRREDIPAGVHRYASVDGSVPGAALVWDHHITGEPISLDALPATVSLANLDGLGTTLADTDAVIGAAVRGRFLGHALFTIRQPRVIKPCTSSTTPASPKRYAAREAI